MIHGLAGSLLSHDGLARAVPAALRGRLGEDQCDGARRQILRWYALAREEVGPASSPRTVFDRLAAPLARSLGFRVVPAGDRPGPYVRAVLYAQAAPAAAMIVTAWGMDPGAAWRETVHHGIGSGVRWCFCVTGPLLRLFDARRTYSRRHLEFDLAVAMDDPEAFAMLWGLLRADALVPAGRAGAPILEQAVRLCERHRADVRASLQHGVHDALLHLLNAFATAGRRGRRRSSLAAMFDESLIVAYRILFLLFAEARGLVPKWHPVYRDSYTLESMRGRIEIQPNPGGLWETLQAIARLAHRGCRAGALRVPPFNGPLFSPSDAPLADSLPLDDGVVRQALLALTTRAGSAGVERISYADLGVEQLGGVYERILDYEPGVESGRSGAITLRPAERRRTTGTFYTPRALAEYLVRRTLAPLVDGAPPERILSLRILDPAMGSGAFLVASCRYLASAYEAALVREGAVAAGDVTSEERASFRRTIAQRCLFGVDVNPMAVQLGRLSLWLATLSADRPLTFLDHRLRAGNSLVGASLQDICRRPSGTRTHAASLPLFDVARLDEAVQAAVTPRLALAADPADTLGQVRGKERLLARLNDRDGPLGRWKAVADLWCARWFGESWTARGAKSDVRRAALHHGTFAALADELLGRQAALPPRVSVELLGQARATAERERFFHWTLEFPEVFHAGDGSPLAAPGFDAVLGNPPWEMLRGDRGDARTRRAAVEAAGRLTEFARGSGVYPLRGGGHANLYQLFVERALSLLRRGGRFGMVLPSGLATDHGCALLRRHLFDRTTIDTFACIENREAVFPIHRGLKFLLVGGAAAGATASLPYRGGIRSADALDALPDLGVDDEAVPVPRALLERMSGPQLAVPDIRTRTDLDLASALAFSAPALGDEDGWHVEFGRELNATDDRPHFSERGRGLPVIEGKQIQPFTVDVDAARFHIPRRAAGALLDPARSFGRARLAYRDVAAATNRVTLIAAIVPPGVVTTHTLFCLRTAVDEEVQHFLCGIFNSYVANYVVRLRVGTHVTTAIIDRLPVPRPGPHERAFRAIAGLSARLAREPGDRAAAARLQAEVARLYGLSLAAFRHVLATFPLIGEDEKAAALAAFAM